MRLAWRGAFGAATAIAGIVAAGLVFGLTAAAADKAPVPKPRPERVVLPAADPTEKIPSVPLNQSGVVGYALMDLDSGEILSAREIDRPFAPASTAKLPTAIYALERLGPDHTFETRVAVDGPIIGTTLQGNVYLVGGGDPELDSDALEPLVRSVSKRGFRRIAGHLVADGSCSPQRPAIDGTQPVDAAYDPSVSGLNLNFNRVRLKWDARGKNKLLRISAKAERLDPDIRGVRVALADVPNAPVLSHSMEGEAEVWHMAGYAFKGEGARWLPVRTPELYAGDVFQSLAGLDGLSLSAPVIGKMPPDAKVIASVRSRPLHEMLKSMLKYSTNLTAEMVGIAASRAGGATPATMADSAAALNAWAAEYAAFPAGDPGFVLVNHSGLSEASRVTPRRMVEVLAASARRHPQPGEAFPHLPGGGVIDLLKPFNIAEKGVKLDYKRIEIAAKTGTMDYVRGLAGYIATPSGRHLAFAIYSNDLDRRPDGPDRNSNRGWIARAQVFERALIRSWILKLEG